MRKAKLIFKTLLVCLIIISCDKEGIDTVVIKFYNESGYKLEDIEINERVVGDLNINENSGYITYESLTIDSGHPMLFSKARLGKEIIGDNRGRGSVCGTSLKRVERGLYEMSIKLYETDDGDKHLYVGLKRE